MGRGGKGDGRKERMKGGRKGERERGQKGGREGSDSTLD